MFVLSLYVKKKGCATDSQSSFLYSAKQPKYVVLRLWVHVCTTEKKCAPHNTFFKNHEPNGLSETSFSYLQNMLIYFHFRKIYFQNIFSL